MIDISHKINPASVMRIVAAVSKHRALDIDLAACLRLLDELRACERAYLARDPRRRVTWRGIAKLKDLRELLNDPVMPVGAIADVLPVAQLRERLDGIICNAPKRPKWPSAARLELLVGQDLPRVWRQLTGKRDTASNAFAAFVNAAVTEMGIEKNLNRRTIAKYAEKLGIRK